jgi:histidinol dehydrogenase
MIRMVAYGDAALANWLDRRVSFDASLVSTVSRTIQDVLERGAEAVLDHTRRYDAPGVERVVDTVSEIEIPEKHQSAIRTAIERVREFHQVQLDTLTEGWTELGNGWGWRTYSHEREGGRETGMIGQRMLPVKSAGIYVPGGQANYPSSVVMNAVPAIVAGVERIVVATPPRRDGHVSPAVQFACRELGIETVLVAGGASAIAAMALGIEGLERVDVIAGPGNKYVNEAKRQLWGTVGLDSYAGPSEVCVLADDSPNITFAAADLIAQVEHAPDNVGVLVALSQETCDAIVGEIEKQLLTTPRAHIVRQSLTDHGIAVVCETTEEALDVINRFAPEHLALHVAEPEALLPRITNASAVMMGTWTAQSVADYCEGPSHTLPTSGAARFASPVGVQTFLKQQSVSMLEQEDAVDLAPIAEAFADMEGLPAHGYAAKLRTEV